MLFLKLLIAFILYSFLGYLFERFIIGKYPCDTFIKYTTGYCLPFLSIYGFASILLILIDAMNLNLILKIIISIIFITLFECIIGKISKNFNKYKTWNYKEYVSLCDGYISIETSLIWSLLIILFFIFNPIKI
jgi:uncharacterized membrane protein